MTTPRRALTGGGRARLVLALTLLGTLALYLIPFGRFVAFPLILLSTFAHEMGHGVGAWLSGGSFTSMMLYADASGIAQTRGDFGRLARAVVSAGGLVGPSLLAAPLFVASARPRFARLALFLLGTACLLAALAVVRNGFGLFFVIACAAVCLGIAIKLGRQASQLACAFVAVQLALSVFSRGDYLFAKSAETGAGTAPSDVAQIADALLLPYWFWGASCGALSVAVLGFGLWMFWRATRAQPAAVVPQCDLTALDHPA